MDTVINVTLSLFVGAAIVLVGLFTIYEIAAIVANLRK